MWSPRGYHSKIGKCYSTLCSKVAIAGVSHSHFAARFRFGFLNQPQKMGLFSLQKEKPLSLEGCSLHVSELPFVGGVFYGQTAQRQTAPAEAAKASEALGRGLEGGSHGVREPGHVPR